MVPLDRLNAFVIKYFEVKADTAPRPILWIFVHFSQNIQHIGDKWDMFLVGKYFF